MSQTVVAGPAGMVDALTKDDQVSRLTLITREGDAFDLDEAKVVVIKGQEDGLARATEIAKEQGGRVLENGDEIAKSIEEQESGAADAMGDLFG